MTFKAYTITPDYFLLILMTSDNVMQYQNVTVRMDCAFKQLIWKVCKLRKEDASDFIRRAVATELARLSYLSNEEKKALGISDPARESHQ